MKESRSCDPELYSRIKDGVGMQEAGEYVGLQSVNGKARVRGHK